MREITFVLGSNAMKLMNGDAITLATNGHVTLVPMTKDDVSMTPPMLELFPKATVVKGNFLPSL
jgi:hypothetical protein